MSPCRGGYAGIDFGERDNCETDTIYILNPDNSKSWIVMTYYPTSETPYTLSQLNDNINNIETISSKIVSKNGKDYIEALKIVQDEELIIIIISCQNKAIVMYNYSPADNHTLNDDNSPRIAEKILSKCT